MEWKSLVFSKGRKSGTFNSSGHWYQKGETFYTIYLFCPHFLQWPEDTYLFTIVEKEGRTKSFQDPLETGLS